MEMVSANFRPLTTAFTPSLWADVFNTFSFDDQLQNKYGENIEALKKDVQNMLMAATSSKLIVLVDKLERLGLAYHFETEIEEKLQQIHNSGNNEDYDLLTTALGFRFLLRQHQYHVSCNVFEKFVEEDKKLKESLCNDVEGLLSFYEAAQVRIHGENILDEAMEFTVEHLNRMVPELKSPTKEKVQQALQLSIHRGVPILTVRFYISIYESTDDDQLLVKLAKFNFNFLQNMYKKELSELSRWWNKFELKSKLPFVRDRVVECYLLGTTYGFEPQYAYVRRDVAKSVLMVTVMDDMYDNYATLEEAQLFTHILDRWDMEEIDVLPEYMQIAYRFIMTIFQEYQHEAAKQDKLFAVPCFKETAKQLGIAYNQELKWVMEREMPCYEEYMKNSVITSGIYVISTALVPTSKYFNEEAIQWLLSAPKIVTSTAKLGRQLQDLASHERENKKGELLTVVDCYMKDKNTSKKEALSKFVELIENGWKDVNTELVKVNCVAKKVVEKVVRFGRTSEVLYKNKVDGFTNPETQLTSYIVALYVDPLLI
ncbi:LOW QUALITY PROTEIN: gamma-cadinene synthase-like [Salvia miltiorrhiza]|uniref:LOW QUALITY PROTEIN: gamma-cadinene synthase-like n=1 Tax=Salvia miltiorrhiza TaxID=226208 RepID=UPI0025AD3F18|nr:LOW QUALITY PROTEIN: gamma-cadinene synthase-like [Salvia miltiorrhiza]